MKPSKFIDQPLVSIHITISILNVINITLLDFLLIFGVEIYLSIFFPAPFIFYISFYITNIHLVIVYLPILLLNFPHIFIINVTLLLLYPRVLL